MPANPNFSIKVTLEEASTIKRALTAQRNALAKQFNPLSKDPANGEIGEEIGRIETMLRRDF